MDPDICSSSKHCFIFHSLCSVLWKCNAKRSGLGFWLIFTHRSIWFYQLATSKKQESKDVENSFRLVACLVVLTSMKHTTIWLTMNCGVIILQSSFLSVDHVTSIAVSWKWSRFSIGCSSKIVIRWFRVQLHYSPHGFSMSGVTYVSGKSHGIWNTFLNCL